MLRIFPRSPRGSARDKLHRDGMVPGFVILVQQRRSDGFAYEPEILVDCGNLGAAGCRPFDIVETRDVHVLRDTETQDLAAHMHIKSYFIVFAENGSDLLKAQGIDKVLEHIITCFSFSHGIPMDKTRPRVISGGLQAILISPVPVPNAGKLLGLKTGEIAYPGMAI